CCFNFSEKRIAPQRIRCYKHTSSTCSRRGLILKMKKGRETCVLQTAQWIKDYLSHLRQKTEGQRP
uniref:C-C motif chemokine n=1 Tax=Canis lupus familiaris TaxID=9615 RepID=A0A8I3RYH5_CANLF